VARLVCICANRRRLWFGSVKPSPAVRVCAAFDYSSLFSDINKKEAIYKSYDELPLFLNAEMVAKLLGVSPSSAYELMHEKGFPAMRVGNRLIVPKAEFQTWVQTQINK